MSPKAIPTVRRTVTPQEMDAQRKGGTVLAPGIWLDKDGDLHFSIPELLAVVELENTPENVEAIVAMCERISRACGPLAIIRQDPES